MLSNIKYIVLIVALASCSKSKRATATGAYNEPHRPQIHFSPAAHWMNDPNGMVYYKNQYHLFFQYYPDSSVWGPMHWGHAISKDLVHWQEQPIALYPDSLGYIFSGSAVVDSNNTSGFGENGKVPLVAIFTHHNMKGEKAGTDTFQNQSIAYSLDDGVTWTKYTNNPVLKNPGIKDFRDPKVMWYENEKKWVMTLATKDHITFYSSKDLKAWTKESEFGKEFGAHGGVWECPDLFVLDYKGKKIWILMVSINPGAPNGGSATQYFTGQFDGNKFIPYQTDARWIDYGTDNYAGVTWSNTNNRKIFIGWMSNWQYANKVPTQVWRSANTLPRELAIEEIGGKYFVTSQPVKELNIISEKIISVEDIYATNYDLTEKVGKLQGPARINITSDQIQAFSFNFSNDTGEKIVIGYDKESNNYFIDRTKSGEIGFEKGFAEKHTAPRLSEKPNLDFTLVIDNASIEMFADNGLTVMTEIFFPNSPFSQVNIQTDKLKVKLLQYNRVNSIWK